jgi:hypothetical protein
METQTRFDLNAAIANWQQELASQPGLAPVVRRELETHLRDTVAELQRHGLNNEESFWLARRRVGQPQQISEEFRKADPAVIWRERIFWMIMALLAVNLWTAFCNPFWAPIRFIHTRFADILPGWILFYLPGWLGESQVLYTLQILVLCVRYIPVFLVAVLLAKGRLKFSHSAVHYLGASRKRFFVGMSGALLLTHSVSLLRGEMYFLFQLIWTVPLIVLATWLMPAKKEITATVA